MQSMDIPSSKGAPIETKKTGPMEIKIVLVGDTAVGKSCLIRNYLENNFSDDYEPTVLDIYKGTKSVNKKQIEIEIHDTSGDAHLSLNRAQQYKQTDVFIICVATNVLESLHSTSKWVNEIKAECSDTPLVLMQTKKDLEEFAEEPVTKEMLEEKVREFGF